MLDRWTNLSTKTIDKIIKDNKNCQPYMRLLDLNNAAYRYGKCRVWIEMSIVFKKRTKKNELEKTIDF